MAATSLLLVEPDPAVARALEQELSRTGYRVATATAGEELMAALTLAPADLILLNVNLPDINGIVLLPQIRHRSALPLIAYSNQHEQLEQVAALKLGADDFIDLPVDTDELGARIEAVLRRADRQRIQSARVDSGELAEGALVMDTVQKAVRYDGRPVHLTLTEFRILEQLLMGKGATVTRDHIASVVWGATSGDIYHNIDVHVGRVRHKLRSVGADSRKLIQTVRNVGWIIKGTSETE